MVFLAVDLEPLHEHAADNVAIQSNSPILTKKRMFVFVVEIMMF